MITLANIASKLTSGELPLLLPVYRIKDGGRKRLFEIKQDLHIRLSNGQEIVIPEGFITDISSTPKIIWWLLPPFGNFNFAAILHDYLYIYKPVTSRRAADREMLIWSNIIHANVHENYLRFLGCRMFGFPVWKKWVKLWK